MKVLDLFSGIGGFSLGLERAGMQTVAFCEIEPFPRAVLAKHWPHVPIYDDIRTLTAQGLKDDGIGTIDVICGGFPCQDISVSGNGEGITGKKSGLWSHYARLIGEIRPKFAIMENVAALLYRGLEVVLGDLAKIGYDAEWHCIPAAAVGAKHIRDRIWILAYPTSHGRQQCYLSSLTDSSKSAPVDYDASGAFGIRWKTVESPILRGVDDVPFRVGSIRSLGNTIVPDIPEIIGRAIIEQNTAPDRAA